MFSKKKKLVNQRQKDLFLCIIINKSEGIFVRNITPETENNDVTGDDSSSKSGLLPRVDTQTHISPDKCRHTNMGLKQGIS